MKRLLVFLALFPWLLLFLWDGTRPVLLEGLWKTFPIRVIANGPDSSAGTDGSQEKEFEAARQFRQKPADRDTAIGATLASPSTFEHILTSSLYESLNLRNDFTPLLASDPDNLTLLALRLRYDFSLSKSATLKGPLFSNWADWSVALIPDTERKVARKGAPYLDPKYLAPAQKNAFSEADWKQLQPYLQAAYRGQKLEPDNAFWDWMLLQALCLLHRQHEFERVLQGISKKTRYHNYLQEELRARLAWQTHWAGELRARESIENWWAIDRFDSSDTAIYGCDAQRYAAQLVMGARLQKQDKRALDLGLSMVHLGRLMRLGAFSGGDSQIGMGIEQYALSMGCLDAIIRTNFLPVAFRKPPTVGGLVGVPTALPTLASTQNQPLKSQWCLSQWDNCARWKLPTFDEILPTPIMRSLGAWSRIALGVGASLWGLALVGVLCARRGDTLPRRRHLVSGVLWTLPGWLAVISLILFNSSMWNSNSSLAILNSDGLGLYLPLSCFPVVMPLLGAAITARWRQWRRNRASNTEKPFNQTMSWGYEKVHDLRPLVWLFLRTIGVGLIVLVSITSPVIFLSYDWGQRTLGTSLLGQLLDLAHQSVFFNPINDAFAPLLLTVFLFVTLCRKPEAKSARREMRLLLRDYSLGACIAGGWIVLLAFGFWMRAEGDFVDFFAPLENGQFVRMAAQKAKLKWD